FGIHDVIAEHDCERLVANEIFRLQDSVAQAKRLALPDVADASHVGDRSNFSEAVQLAALAKQMFKLERNIKVIFNGALVATGYDDDGFNSGSDCLLDDVLD